MAEATSEVTSEGDVAVLNDQWQIPTLVEHEDDVLVGAVARPRLLQALKAHLALGVPQAGVAVDDLARRQVVAHEEDVVALIRAAASLRPATVQRNS